MYTSVNKYKRITLTYLLISVVTAVFAGVYEHFSHGVVSLLMVTSCAAPLILGAVPSLFFGAAKASLPRAASTSWRLGVAALTVGMIYGGVIEIYGTDSPYTAWYFVAAGAMFVISLVMLAVGKKIKP